ncbi:hypothetical protein BD410DRAFT_791175 [Rickenella mellea]|uniref:Uncharacterized protein n=1 Tax=Rickenella mellea TaxID=50990 RepID=A0A4Y7PXH7_9AGAM|nr:hypothetical protein BD410DRAFT_791175 [Rickenella mellea]
MIIYNILIHVRIVVYRIRQYTEKCLQKICVDFPLPSELSNYVHLKRSYPFDM